MTGEGKDASLRSVVGRPRGFTLVDLGASHRETVPPIVRSSDAFTRAIIQVGRR